MRPVLLRLDGLSWPVALALLAVAVILVGGWLLWTRRRGGVTREHFATAGVLLALSAILLTILSVLQEIRVNSYGAALVLGFVVGAVAAVRLGRRRGIIPERVLDLGLFILVGAIVGARVGYIILSPEQEPLFDFSAILASGLGGLSFHGGLVGGFLTGSAYIFYQRLSYWRVADILAPAIAVGYAITRIGCFLNGCCFGKAADVPWAVVFPVVDSAHRHPSQLYASLIGFAVFGILLLLARGNSLGRAGRLFMVFLVLEGIERFVMEIFREPDPLYTGAITLAQGVSIIIALVGVAGWFLLPKRPAVDPASEPAKAMAAK